MDYGVALMHKAIGDGKSGSSSTCLQTQMRELALWLVRH